MNSVRIEQETARKAYAPLPPRKERYVDGGYYGMTLADMLNAAASLQAAGVPGTARVIISRGGAYYGGDSPHIRAEWTEETQ